MKRWIVPVLLVLVGFAHQHHLITATLHPPEGFKPPTDLARPLALMSWSGLWAPNPDRVQTDWPLELVRDERWWGYRISADPKENLALLRFAHPAPPAGETVVLQVRLHSLSRASVPRGGTVAVRNLFFGTDAEHEKPRHSLWLQTDKTGFHMAGSTGGFNSPDNYAAKNRVLWLASVLDAQKRTYVLYVNGVKAFEQAFLPNSSFNPIEDLLVGRGVKPRTSVEGVVSWVGYWDRPLSPEEIEPWRQAVAAQQAGWEQTHWLGDLLGPLFWGLLLGWLAVEHRLVWLVLLQSARVLQWSARRLGQDPRRLRIERLARHYGLWRDDLDLEQLQLELLRHHGPQRDLSGHPASYLDGQTDALYAQAFPPSQQP